MTTVYLASFETRYFTFQAVGDSREAAINALRAGMRKHGQQLTIPVDWAAGYEDEINVVPLRLNIDTARDSVEVI